MAAKPRKEIDIATYAGRFAVRLRMLREKAKLSVEELAEKSGIPRTTIYNWESSISEPSIGQLSVIASALGVSVRKLMPEE